MGRNGRSPVLVARLDSLGDVLLTGPAVRAVARQAEVVYLCGPRGRVAVDLLPGVSRVIEWRAPWIDPDPEPVEPRQCRRLVDEIGSLEPTQAALLGSSHQSPLPLALLLRLAGVEELAAVSHDYAGSLLDHRVRGDPEVHEVERSLRVVGALGFSALDDRLAVNLPRREPKLPRQLRHQSYIAVHPTASVPARTLPSKRWTQVVAALVRAGWKVAVTASPAEREVAASVSAGRPGVVDLAGTSLPELGSLLARATAVVTGNTGPMHLAAAVGTPVVGVFPPTVPADRWRPWQVPHALLGNQDIACAGCRSKECPLPAQYCIADITPADIVTAVEQLVSGRVAA